MLAIVSYMYVQGKKNQNCLKVKTVFGLLKKEKRKFDFNTYKNSFRNYGCLNIKGKCHIYMYIPHTVQY